MKEFILDKFNNWWNGFNNSATGMSGKKITACAVVITSICSPMITWTYWAYKHDDWSLFPALLGIVCGFVGALFGLNVWDKKANTTAPPSPTPAPITPANTDAPKDEITNP